MQQYFAQWLLTFLDALRYKITINSQSALTIFLEKYEHHEGSGKGLTGAGGLWTETDSSLTKEYNKTNYTAIVSDPSARKTLKK